MKYNDFKKDTAYRVVAGDNDNFSAVDLFWIDSVHGSLIFSGSLGGWIDKEDINDTFFDGLTIEEDTDYVVVTMKNGNTQIFHKSLVNIPHSNRNKMKKCRTETDVYAWIDVNDKLPKGADKSGKLCENIWMLFDNGKVYAGWMNGITEKVYYINERDDFVLSAPISRVKMWMKKPKPPEDFQK